MTRRIFAVLLMACECCFAGGAVGETLPSSMKLEAAYTADFLANLSGGLEEGTGYLDNLDVVLEGDLERLVGWSDTRFVLYGLYNNGHDFSGRYVGDLQVASNIETGVPALRLFEAYIESRLGDDVSVLFGLYDLNSEFDALETSSLFLHSSHGIGSDVGQTGEAGPSIFPVTSLGLRLAWEPDEAWAARLAILDAVPGKPDEPGRTAIDLDRDEGLLLVGELGRAWRDARVLAGAWRYTAAFADPVASATAARTVEAKGNHGLYLRGEWRPDGAASPQLFGRIGWAAPRFNVFKWFISAGAVWDDAPGGTFGVALAWAEGASPERRRAALGGMSADSREVGVELSYAFAATNWLSLQPHLQYIVNPGLDPALENAWIAGVRMTLNLLESPWNTR